MGLMNKIILGAATGAGLNKWAADRDWRTKRQAEAKDWAGDPLFPTRWPLTDPKQMELMTQDVDKWEAMGRNRSFDQAVRGGVMGAIAGAALHAGRRRRVPAREPPAPPPPPPRLPGENVMMHPYHDVHPGAHGWGVPGARIARAA